MSLEELTKKYNKMQTKYGDKNLDAITFGGLSSNPDICFVFMNPTSKNIASSKEWTGPKSPWIGTKNIWNLFVQTSLFDTNIYNEIKNKKSSEWTKDFAIKVYDEVKNNKVYITNLGKCTQLDARIVPNKVYKEYLNLLEEEISIVNPKVITGKYEITGFVDGKPNDYYCITILDEFGRSGSTAYVGEKVIFENYKNSNMI